MTRARLPCSLHFPDLSLRTKVSIIQHIFFSRSHEFTNRYVRDFIVETWERHRLWVTKYHCLPTSILQKNSACWIVHSDQVCGALSYYIKKKYHRRRSRRNVVQMHSAIREDRTSPVNPTWTGHRMVCNLWQGVYYSTGVVYINIVMSCGSSHMHAMQNTKQTWWCLSIAWVVHLKPLFQRVLVNLKHT